MTEKEKMLAGEVYSAVDPELIEELMAKERFFMNITHCVRLKPSG